MLDLVRFSTSDPAKLSQELDRFVRSVQRELAAVTLAAAPRFTLRTITQGSPSGTVVVAPKLDELVPVNPALGAVDVALPTPAAKDAGRGLLVVVRSTANAVTLRPGSGTVNTVAGTYALPAVRAAYLVFWDGTGWWTVNDA